MKRRDFLRLSAYGTVMLGVPFIAGCSHKTANAAVEQPAFLMQFMDKQSIVQTGKVYRAMVPAESSAGKLEEILMEKSDITPTTPAEQVHAHFADKSQQDFKANRTTVVDGWILSATEARQCALFSLSQS